MKTPAALLLLLATCTLHAQNRSTTVASFGATGDGSDETGKIQAALNSNNGSIYFDAKTYNFSRLVLKPNHTLYLQGATLKIDPSAAAVKGGYIAAAGPMTYSADVSFQVDSASTHFTWSDASNLSVGSIVEISGPAYSPQFGSAEAYKTGWYAQVVGISGTTVTLDFPAQASFTATHIKQYTPLTGIKIIGPGTLDFNGHRGFGLALYHALGAQIKDLKVLGGDSLEIGLHLTGCHLLCERDSVQNVMRNGGLGYGIQIQGTQDTVRYCVNSGAKHCFTSANRDYFSWIVLSHLKATSDGGGPGIDFHGNAQGIIEYSIVDGGTSATVNIDVRSNNTTVRDNYLTLTTSPKGGMRRNIFAFECAVNNINIYNNIGIIIGSSAPAAFFTNSGAQVAPSTNINIHDNQIYGGSINLVDAQTGPAVLISNNTFYQMQNTPTIKASNYNGAQNAFKGIATPPPIPQQL